MGWENKGKTKVSFTLWSLMSMKGTGPSLIQRISSSSEGWAEAVQAELVLLRVQISMAFGGGRREFVCSVLTLCSFWTAANSKHGL